MARMWRSVKQFADMEYGGDLHRATLAIVYGVNLTDEEQKHLSAMVPPDTANHAILIQLGSMMSEIYQKLFAEEAAPPAVAQTEGDHE